MSSLPCAFFESEPIQANMENLKCGEIYIRIDGIISLACGFCEVGEFFALDAFSDHFDSHFPARNLTATTTIKCEPLIIKPEDTHSISSFGDQVDDAASNDPLHSEPYTSVSQLPVCDRALEMDIYKVENIYGDWVNDNENEETLRLSCDYCQALVSSKNEMINHIRQMHFFGFGFDQSDKQFPSKHPRYTHSAKAHGKTKFKCDFCDALFGSEKLFIKHKYKVHSVGDPCRYCNKQLSSKYARILHEKSHTNGAVSNEKFLRGVCTCSLPECPKHKFTCDICNAGATGKGYLELHKWRQHAIGETCRHCKKEFATSYVRDKHETTHIDEPDVKEKHQQPECPKFTNGQTVKLREKRESFQCETCDETFLLQGKLRTHNWVAHRISSANEKFRRGVCTCRRPECLKHKFTCDICNAGTTGKGYLEMHKWREHGVGVSCRHCQKQCSTSLGRDKHEARHIGEPNIKKEYPACHCKEPECPKGQCRLVFREIKETFKCEACDAVFLLQGERRRHKWAAHQIGAKCRFCDKQFFEVVSRNVHERIHTGKRPFQCPYCPQTASAKQSMKYHIMVHENDLPFLCPTCGKRFVSIAKLNMHLREKHRSEADARPKRFQCTMCDQSFTYKSTLTNHYKQKHQMGETVVVTCDICQRKCTSIKSLRQHMNIHMETKRYKCRYCEMKFAQAAGKRGHERNRHENVVC